MVDSAVADELLTMMREQRQMLERTAAATIGTVPVEARREQRHMFVDHADRLKEILHAHGWPTAARVGEEASEAAWLVAQHADTQREVQRLALQLLKAAVDGGEASRTKLAFLEDRTAVNEGRLQVYGTQIADVVDGEPIPWPCVDPERLDERRAEVGIEPFAVNASRYL